MNLPLDENTGVMGRENKRQFVYGDIVRVLYEQKFKTNAEGEKVILSTVVKLITLLRPAPTQLQTR
jgi:hypothetical protein